MPPSRSSISFFVLALALLATRPASADPPDAGARHALEIDVGGGMSLLSDMPEELDLAPGGVITGRVMVDVGELRADVRYMMFDPSHPEQFQLRGDARLLFVTIHDFTWRRTDAGELMRLMGGIGGEIELPDGVGHLMIDAGGAGLRFGAYDNVDRPFTEIYGAYAGLTARLSFWEIRNELRVAVQGWAAPESFSLDLEASFAALVPGFTASNRLYIQALREDAISLGPELDVQVEMVLDKVLVVATVGISGSLGI